MLQRALAVCLVDCMLKCPPEPAPHPRLVVQHAPPLFVLPPLGNTLDSSPASLAAAAAAAAPAKPAKGKSGGGKGGGGGKKKGVTFAGGEGDTSMGGNSGGGDGESGGGGGAGGSGSGRAGSSLYINSGGNGSTLQQTSGGGTTQGGGAFATQGVAVAVCGGLGRMAAEAWKQRSLLLPALATLGVGAAAAQEQHCYAMLPSAAYVLADLHRCVPACMPACSRQGRPISGNGPVPQSTLLRCPACLTCALLQQAQGGPDQRRQALWRPWQAPRCAAAAAGGSGRSDGGAAAGGTGPCAARHPLPPGCG